MDLYSTKVFCCIISYNRKMYTPKKLLECVHAETFVVVKFESRSSRGVLDTTLCNKAYQSLPTGRWFYPGTQVSSTNKILFYSNIACGFGIRSQSCFLILPASAGNIRIELWLRIPKGITNQ